MYSLGQLGKSLNQGKVIAQDLFVTRDERRLRAIKNSRKIKTAKRRKRK